MGKGYGRANGAVNLLDLNNGELNVTGKDSVTARSGGKAEVTNVKANGYDNATYNGLGVYVAGSEITAWLCRQKPRRACR